MSRWTNPIASPVVGRRGGRNRLLATFTACAFLLLPGATRPLSAGTESPYTFGVFPFLFPNQIEQIFLPIATRLSERLGHEVRLRNGSTFEDFQKALEEEQFDLAFVQPFDYVRFAAKNGYLPLVARADPLAALLVLRDDSPIRSVEALRGKVVALPPKTAAVSYLVLSLLEDHGLIPGETVTIRYTQNHEACLASMLVQDVATCGTARGPLSVFESRSRAKTRILATSTPIPGSLMVAHHRLGAQEIARIRTELLNYSPSLLSRDWSPEENGVFVPIRDPDYEPVRRIATRLGIL